MKLTLDPWQTKVLETKGDIVLRSGRQVGKSTVVAVKAGEFAANHKKKTILVVASVERQAYLLFEKILAYIYENYEKKIETGPNRPTKTRIKLKNGSVVYCLPTGLTGYGIRGYTIDLLIADEAAFIPEDVWTAITPMLAASKGTKWLLSTPHGKEGYYYECFNDPNFTAFHISSFDCPRIPKEFLDREQKRMTKVQFAQEYLGEFVDELMQFFPSDLIKACMTLSKSNPPGKHGSAFCGLDVARMGEDETVLISLDKRDDKCLMMDMMITTKTLLTDTVAMVKMADQKFDFKRIYIDDGGLGVGVFDPLLKDDQTRRKVVAINNARRSLDREEKQKKKLDKEVLYTNLLYLMEKGKIEFFDEAEIMLSLRSVQFEYTQDRELKISGNYTHIAEALIRAAWCMKEKNLSIWVR